MPHDLKGQQGAILDVMGLLDEPLTGPQIVLALKLRRVTGNEGAIRRSRRDLELAGLLEGTKIRVGTGEAYVLTDKGRKLYQERLTQALVDEAVQ